MDGYNIYDGAELRGRTPWPVVESSIWLRLGFVALCVAVIALTELYKGEINPLAAVAWIFGGAWATALSWRRAKLLLDRLDEGDASSAATSDAIVPRETTHPAWDRRNVTTTSAPSQAGS